MEVRHRGLRRNPPGHRSTDLDSLSHTITGLTPGTEYTIRVAPFNEEDDSMFTNSEGHSRAREITATVPVPPLAVSLSRLDGQITAAWAPYGVPVAKYLVQWRSGDQSYDETRQQEEPGGEESYSVTIDGLDNDTSYTVRVAALDDQGQELSADEQTVQRWSAFDHIETAFIDPYMEAHPVAGRGLVRGAGQDQSQREREFRPTTNTATRSTSTAPTSITGWW